MRRFMLIVLAAVVFVGGCASHTEVGGKRFGHTFGWGNEASSTADPYSLQPEEATRY